MSGFKAYDIRGIVNVDFSLDDIYRIGYYLPRLLSAEKVLVGRDARISSPDIYNALSEGLVDAGATVHYVGLSTTPMIYYLTAKYGYSASVQITASHNPKEYNGLKISAQDAMPVGYDNGLGKLEQMIRNEPVPNLKKGNIQDLDFKTEYLNFLRRFVPENYPEISIDTSNGMAGLLLPDLMGNHPHYLFLEPDGSFPNHEANPLNENNLHSIKSLVTSSKSALGAIFDGDADRVVFIDETGHSIPPDLIIAVLGHHFLEKEKGNILVDIRTSKSVEEYLAPMGGTVHTWRVGRAYATPRLKELSGIYGGELAGHFYFRDFYYSDSGILAFLLALKVFNQMQQEGIPVSGLINRIRKYYNSGELNFKILDKVRAMESLCRQLPLAESPLKKYDFDGFRYDFRDWWFNVRVSNTEPYLRVLIETNSSSLLEEKTSLARAILAEYE